MEPQAYSNFYVNLMSDENTEGCSNGSKHYQTSGLDKVICQFFAYMYDSSQMLVVLNHMK
jgi:hypothetical protein